MNDLSNAATAEIDAYLKTQEQKNLLRFITCGSVDDGKSTFIGRLLWDSKLLFEDQLAALTAESKRAGTQNGDIDYALLLDGLQAEREQGITIDPDHAAQLSRLAAWHQKGRARRQQDGSGGL